MAPLGDMYATLEDLMDSVQLPTCGEVYSISSRRAWTYCRVAYQAAHLQDGGAQWRERSSLIAETVAAEALSRNYAPGSSYATFVSALQGVVAAVEALISRYQKSASEAQAGQAKAEAAAPPPSPPQPEPVLVSYPTELCHVCRNFPGDPCFNCQLVMKGTEGSDSCSDCEP